jgi:hypothetical protein
VCFWWFAFGLTEDTADLSILAFLFLFQNHRRDKRRQWDGISTTNALRGKWRMRRCTRGPFVNPNELAGRPSMEGTGVITPMVRTATFLCLAAALTFAQDHQAVVNEHGDHVMAFSHDNTTHHFELNYDGGVIDVRSNDLQDTESRTQIRNHFRHIAQMFA